MLSETEGSNLLKIDIDGLDQNKTRFPRNLDSSKTLANAWRPQLHCVGVIVWGVPRIYEEIWNLFFSMWFNYSLVSNGHLNPHAILHSEILLSQVLEGYLLLEPDLAKDASAEVTVLLKAIDWAEEELARRGRALPEHLIVEALGF